MASRSPPLVSWALLTSERKLTPEDRGTLYLFKLLTQPVILKKTYCPTRSPRSCYCVGELMHLLASCPGRRGVQGAGGKEHSYISESWSTPVYPFSPDVQTAEGGKENSCSEGQGNSQEQCQELVHHVFADFKEGMAADPHFVKGVRRHRLCNYILEAHLQRQDTGIPNCHPTCGPPGRRGARVGEESWDALSSLRVKLGSQEFG